MKRRPIIAGALLLLLTGILVMVWTALAWPPPRLIWKYGLPPVGGPTREIRRIAGIEFVAVAPGYAFVSRRVRLDPVARLTARDPLVDESVCAWIDLEREIWIARRRVSVELASRFAANSHARETGGADVKLLEGLANE